LKIRIILALLTLCTAAQGANVLQPFVDKHELAGAVTLVASKDKVLAVEAVGWADIAARRPMRTDCVFWIASQSKPITAARARWCVDRNVLKSG
jgi:CubicO group peptidase (beta-lactamase class C family)